MRSIFPLSPPQKFQTSSPHKILSLSLSLHSLISPILFPNRRRRTRRNSSRPKYISRPLNKIHGSCSYSPSSYYNISRQARASGARGWGEEKGRRRRVARTMRKYTCTRGSTRGSRLYINTRWIRKLVAVPKQLCVSQAWAARSRADGPCYLGMDAYACKRGNWAVGPIGIIGLNTLAR